MPSLDIEKEIKEFREFYNENEQLYINACESLNSLISLLLTKNENFTSPNVESRVKNREECLKKFGRKYQSKLEKEEEPYAIKDHITDIIGLRVICLYDTEIEPIRKCLEENFEVIDVTDKVNQIEEKEDVFGYKGLHLDLRIDEKRKDLPEYSKFRDLRFEVQIRTIVQDAWSNVDHKIKYKKNIPHTLKRRINVLAALFELADNEFIRIKEATEKIEESASESDGESSDEKLVVNNFLKIVKSVDQFEGYDFFDHKIDGFIDDLKELNEDITAHELDEAITNNADLLERYRKFQNQKHSNNLNPYTIIRHALYNFDSEVYHDALFDMQRNNFSEWLEN